jgi:hypothetical protein
MVSNAAARAFSVKEIEKFSLGEGSEKPKEFVPKG